MRRTPMIHATGAVLVVGQIALAQSLYERTAEPQEGRVAESAPAVEGPPELVQVSLFAVEPPEPRRFQQHDLVTIIVSERTRYDRSIESETEKRFDQDFNVGEFIDLLELLQLRVVPEDGVPVGANLGSDTQFEAEATLSQEDEMTDRLGARVIEAKPNGTLLLEARRTLVTDDSEVVVVLSGYCRSEDITDSNTVQSNQLYDMVLNVQNAGEIRRSTQKGVITKLLETLFNF